MHTLLGVTLLVLGVLYGLLWHNQPASQRDSERPANRTQPPRGN